MWIEYVLVSLIPFVFMGSIYAWCAKFPDLGDNPSRGGGERLAGRVST